MHLLYGLQISVPPVLQMARHTLSSSQVGLLSLALCRGAGQGVKLLTRYSWRNAKHIMKGFRFYFIFDRSIMTFNKSVINFCMS